MPEKLESEITLGYREFVAGVDNIIKTNQKLDQSVDTTFARVDTSSKAAFAKLQQNAKTLAGNLSNIFSGMQVKAAQSFDLSQLEQKLGRVGQLGRQAFGSTLASAGGFEQGLRNINTIAHLSEKELQAFGDRLQSVGRDIGVAVTPTQATASAYEILSSNFAKAADAQKILGPALKLTADGTTQAGDATKVLTGILNAWGDGADKASLRADQLFQTVNLGATTMPELAQSLGNVIGLASTAGVSFEEIAASIATLTINGQQTSEATLGLRSAIGALINPSEKAQKQFAALGITVNAQTLKSKGFIQTLKEISAAANGNAEAMGNIFEGNAAFSVAATLSKDAGLKLADSYKQISEAAGSSDKVVQEVNKGFNTSAKQTEAAFERLKTSAGEAILPLATLFAQSVTGVIDGLDKLDPKIKVGALAVIGLGTAFATAGTLIAGASLAIPAITGQLSTLGFTVANVGKIWAFLNQTIAISFTGSAAGLIKTALGGITTAFTGLGTGITAVATSAAFGAAAMIGMGAIVVGITAKLVDAIHASHELNDEFITLGENYKDAGKDVKLGLNTGALLDGRSAAELRKAGANTDTIDEAIRKQQAGIDRETVSVDAFGNTSISNDPLAKDDPERVMAEERIKRLKELRTEIKALEAEEKSQTAASTQLLGLINQSYDQGSDVVRKSDKEEEKQRKEAAEDTYRDALQEIELSKKTHAEKAQLFRQLLELYSQDKDKRRDIVRQIAQEEKAAEKEVADAQEAAHKKREKALEDRKKQEQQNIKDLREQRKTAADQEIEDADQRLAELEKLEARGQDVTKQKSEQVKRKAKAETTKVDIELESTKGQLFDPEAIKEADKTAKSEKARIKREEAGEIEEIGRKESQAALQREQELVQAQEQIQSQKLAYYQEQLAAGKSVEAQIKTIALDNLKLKEREIALQAALAKQLTDDPVRIAQIEEKAQLDIRAARQATREEIEKTTEALKKQKAESSPLNLGGNPYSAEEFFKQNNGFFDITKPKSAGKGSSKFISSALDTTSIDAMIQRSPSSDSIKNMSAGKYPGEPGSAAESAASTTSQIVVAGQFELIDSSTGKQVGRLKSLTINGKGSDAEEAARGMLWGSY